MKKKSLLILPVLLLALAACDNEEEEVVEETVPEATETETGTETESESEDTHNAPVRSAIETAPEGAIGVLDFSGIDKTNTSDQTVDTLTTLFKESWVAASDVEQANIVPLDNEEEETSLPFTVTGVSKVLLGAGGSTAYGNDYWQLSTQCIKLSNSPTSNTHVDGSITLDFGETAVSKVQVEALKWSTTETASLEVAETVSGDTPEPTAETSASEESTEISAANDLEVTTPDVLTFELGGSGASSITISATNRILIFSISFWTVAAEA